MKTRRYINLITPHVIITGCAIVLAATVPAMDIWREEIIAGTLVSLSNFAVLVWVLDNIFNKKRVAISVSIIVFKWPILGFVLYKLVVTHQFDIVGLIVGLSSLVPSVVLLGIFLPKGQTKERDNGSL